MSEQSNKASVPSAEAMAIAQTYRHSKALTAILAADLDSFAQFRVRAAVERCIEIAEGYGERVENHLANGGETPFKRGAVFGAVTVGGSIRRSFAALLAKEPK